MPPLPICFFFKNKAIELKQAGLILALGKLTFWRFKVCLFSDTGTKVGCQPGASSEMNIRKHRRRDNESPAIYIQHGRSRNITNRHKQLDWMVLKLMAIGDTGGRELIRITVN